MTAAVASQGRLRTSIRSTMRVGAPRGPAETTESCFEVPWIYPDFGRDRSHISINIDRQYKVLSKPYGTSLIDTVHVEAQTEWEFVPQQRQFQLNHVLRLVLP